MLKSLAGNGEEGGERRGRRGRQGTKSKAAGDEEEGEDEGRINICGLPQSKAESGKIRNDLSPLEEL